MKKRVLFFVLINLFLANSFCYGDGYDRFDIKYGMHEKIVTKLYGEPISVEKIKTNPIPQKKPFIK